ncbi:MAG: TIGR00725 family protein [Enhygromyxa sp.]
MSARRPVLAVIGSGGRIDPAIAAAAEELGRLAIEAGFRLVSGGRDGVMEAASRGARAAPSWREGDVIGILPSYDRAEANAHVDVVIPTGLGIARNVVVVASADVVVALAGGSGTLSEIAIAWQLGKPIIGLDLKLGPLGGWGERAGGIAIDDRRSDEVRRASSAAEAIELARAALADA